MSVLTELKSTAPTWALDEVDLDDDAVTATAGIPAGATFGAAGPGAMPGR